MHALDAQFPGEFGTLNHSERFAAQFAPILLKNIRAVQVRAIHTTIRALRLPSDYARIIDGLTLQSGESLLIHLIAFVTREGCVQVTLLDLIPQGRPAESSAHTPKKSLLAFHGLASTVDKINAVEEAYALNTPDRALRWAVQAADGAVEGPYGLRVGDECARQLELPADLGWGALDGFHACDSSGAAADKSSSARVDYHAKYGRVLQSMRHHFAFGNGRVVARSMARRYHLPFSRPSAPHSQTTRAVMYESARCPRVLFRNLPTYVKALKFREWEAVTDARIKRTHNLQRAGVANPIVAPRVGTRTKQAKLYRHLGRELLDPEMLIWVSGRYEHRRHILLNYGQIAQNTIVFSGLEKQLSQERSSWEALRYMAAARSLSTVVYIYEFLQPVVNFTLLRSFITVLAHRVAGKCYPMTIGILLQILLKRTIWGIELGLTAEVAHPFEEPSIAQARIALGIHRLPEQVRTRKETISCVRRATHELYLWSRDERANFIKRVEFWESFSPTAPTSRPAVATDHPVAIDEPTFESSDDSGNESGNDSGNHGVGQRGTSNESLGENNGESDSESVAF